MLKDKVEALLTAFFEENPQLFLIDLKITPDNKINIIIDGDHGVTLKDCVAVSRQVEHNLNREEEDFSLEVASAGATAPLVNNRQFNKNIGRKLAIKTIHRELEAKLLEANLENIKVSWSEREPKPLGKGKVTVVKEETIPLKELVEVKVMITFN